MRYIFYVNVKHIHQSPQSIQDFINKFQKSIEYFFREDETVMYVPVVEGITRLERLED